MSLTSRIPSDQNYYLLITNRWILGVAGRILKEFLVGLRRCSLHPFDAGNVPVAGSYVE